MSTSDESSSESTSETTTSSTSESEDTASEMDYGDPGETWGTSKSGRYDTRGGSRRSSAATIRGMEQTARKGVAKTAAIATTLLGFLCIGLTLLCCFVIIVVAIIIIVAVAIGLGAFFLIPRKPSTTMAEADPATIQYVYQNGTGEPVSFSYICTRTMENDNFYGIDVISGVWRAFVTSAPGTTANQLNNDIDLQLSLQAQGEEYPFSIGSNGEEERSYAISVDQITFRESIKPYLRSVCQNGTGSFTLRPQLVEEIEYELWGGDVTIEKDGPEFTVQC